MPDRIIRAAILSSDAVNSLSLGAEVFYRRLMSVADDFGRYDGRPGMLLAHLYPLRIDSTSPSDVSGWLAECSAGGLVVLYVVDGKPFVEIARFRQRTRAHTSKYPAASDGAGVTPSDVRAPPSDDRAPPSSAHVVDVVVGDVVDISKASPSHVNASSVDQPGKQVVVGKGTAALRAGAVSGFAVFWQTYPHRVAKGAAEKAWSALKPDAETLDAILDGIARAMQGEAWQKDRGRFIPHPATWLRAKGWLDEVQAPRPAAGRAAAVQSLYPAIQPKESARDITGESKRVG